MTISLRGTNGRVWSVRDEVLAQGAMKDVHFTTDGTHVVGFYRDGADPTARMRLDKIVGSYRAGVFDGATGEFWRSRFCWPVDVGIAPDGRLAVVTPKYSDEFFFTKGSVGGDSFGIRGREKEGKWFVSLRNRRHLDPSERGTWREYLRICLNLSRAVRRMHASGLAHSDLSYRNVLINPLTGSACVIDVDGLVVDGIFPAEVMGTPDFIAPEVVATAGLPLHDPKRKHPSPATDRHALAVLITMYLLCRHPLRGRRVHDEDAARDEELAMGSCALWNEDPSDPSNRVNPAELADAERRLGDPAVVPYTVVGPYLAPLMQRSFTVGLHDPHQRPVAQEWETALLQTLDSLVPCSNPACEQKWFAYDGSAALTCPFCGTATTGPLPVLIPYVRVGEGKYQPEPRRIVVSHDMQLMPWHVYRDVLPNENTPDQHRRRMGYFQRHGGQWHLVNERLPAAAVVDSAGSRTPMPPGQPVALREGMRILLSPEPTGRLVNVQLVGR